MKGIMNFRLFKWPKIKKKGTVYFAIGFIFCAIFTNLLDSEGSISNFELIDSKNFSSNSRKLQPQKRFEITKHRGRSRNVITSLSSDGRDVISDILQHFALKEGVEVGVLMGNFSRQILSKWTSCEKYILVDPWLHQENYHAKSNVEQDEQEIVMKTALKNIEPWRNIVETCRNFSHLCALDYNNSSFDYVYIDARHDFKGVYEDLKVWYPKVRSGGIISGHDYLDDLDVYSRSKSNWTVQSDGTLDYGRQAVKGAVNLFFAGKEQYVNILNDTSAYKSWVVLKSGGRRKYNTVMHFIDFRCFDIVLCDYTPDSILKNIKQWEREHPDYISVLWTASIVREIFADEMSVFDNEYNRNIRLFEDYMKLKILHRYGGFFVHNYLWPLQGIDRIIGSGMRTQLPFILCNSQTETSSLVNKKKNCPQLFSSYIFGSSKGHKELQSMSTMHAELSKKGEFSEDGTITTLFLQIWKQFNTTGLELGAPFPCISGMKNERCVASIGESVN